MSKVNQVYLLGKVASDPEVRYFGYEQIHATFRLTTQEHIPTTNDPDRLVSITHRVSVWGQLASFIELNIRREMMVRLRGRLTYGKETDRDGYTRTWPEVECLQIDVVEPLTAPAPTPPLPTEEHDWSSYAPLDDEDPIA